MPLVALIEEQRRDARADRFPLAREHEGFIRESERPGDGDARAGGTAPAVDFGSLTVEDKTR
jgi:hypothetical protein